jgi:hypothetical protein
MGMSRHLWAAPALLFAAVTLAACGDMGRLQTAALQPAAPALKPNRTIATHPCLLWRLV